METARWRDERILLIGEDIEGPYGGAFKVTKNLSSEFPNRVRNTPISEAAIIGLGNGLALSGMIAVCEIMFGDFLTLAADQIINHASKFGYMYNGQVQPRLIIRTPMGGKRGYGPTHSQSLEKHFLGVPHLRVVASSLVHDPAAVLRALLAQNRPVLLIEPDRRAYRETGRFTPPNRSPEKAYAHPVLANGKLYLRDQGTLLAYDMRKK